MMMTKKNDNNQYKRNNLINIMEKLKIYIQLV